MEVKVIADSIHNGKRITTLQLRYWRAIHAEMMTHRAFSRNASSSRAIPIALTVSQVEEEPASPAFWGKNQAGMVADSQIDKVSEAKNWWLESARLAAEQARKGMSLGLHKQVVNRILEPFQYINVLVTATEWDNFFALRIEPSAQPEMHDLALEMKRVMDESTPVERMFHLPYVTEAEVDEAIQTFGTMNTYPAYVELAKLSAARACRVSYNKHDGNPTTKEDDLKRFQLLTDPSHPLHASPLEHQAYACKTPDARSRNFVGWIQYRETYEEILSINDNQPSLL